MFNRYPHTGFIVSKEETQDVNGDFVGLKVKREISGRYQPGSGSKDVDYSSKFFCKKLDVKPFELDEKTFEYGGRDFKIVQFHNYQTHCELWLS